MNAVTTSAAATAMVEFAPARIILRGDTMTEKRVNVVKEGSAALGLLLATEKGKVGIAARESASMTGFVKMVREVRTGNYKTLAGALAVILGQSIVISSRAGYESLGDRFEGMLADLKDGGYKNDKPTAKRVALEKAIALVNNTNEAVATLLAREAEDKAARLAEEQRQLSTEQAAA